MIRFSAGWFAALGIVVLAGCTRTPAPEAEESSAGGSVSSASSAADVEAIRAADSAWFQAYNRHDADAVAALYADDAVLSMPGVPPVRGRAAVRDALQRDIEATARGGYTFKEGATGAFGASGDLGWTWNSFTVTDSSGKTIDVGKFVSVLARRDGKWLIIHDIWNSDSPPAPAT
jgi:uncharacterized protein (TIGR02246 family)